MSSLKHVGAASLLSGIMSVVGLSSFQATRFIQMPSEKRYNVPLVKTKNKNNNTTTNKKQQQHTNNKQKPTRTEENNSDNVSGQALFLQPFVI